ncbi:HAMP domain-containing protein [Corticibacter populi]|uniref:histidine kinase n=1 Tax=Corticibacter populi TaxID=1550736 RepID=A0A3M6QNT1_9BURK|nr:ATP-binding protein [Corticibacter populi]RMX04169.1 HAMP domain-containing protein [Corticibacter populi]RZS33191.1 signal transduction histidine kinase [Corticibacter populi]
MALKNNPFSQRMYLRIWLAVVGCVALLMMAMGWAWKVAEERNVQTQVEEPRAITIYRSDGSEPPRQALAMRHHSRQPGFALALTLDDGTDYVLQFDPRHDRPPPKPRDDGAFWMRPPFGFLWLLGLVGLSVIIGVFPIIRHLMKRLETLRLGVQRFGEGDLSVRIPDNGHDEVAELAMQFNAAAARIETLVRSHKTLLANASHELRSPLARIRMGLELAGNVPPSPATRREIQRNIAELDQLIDEILLSSRLDLAEDTALRLEPVDLIGLSAEEAARVGAELEVEQPDDPAHPLTMELQGEAKLLRRAIRNLLENARRYSDGPIELWLRQAPGSIEIRVGDRGPGVAPELRTRIFEPFFRVPGASERSGGVGLGLALVKTIAERHGGSVHCEARPGGGSVFVLRLPVRMA